MRSARACSPGVRTRRFRRSCVSRLSSRQRSPRPGPSSTATGTRATRHHGPADACGLAGSMRVRRRPRLRGRDARPRHTLRARERLRRKLRLEPGVDVENGSGLCADGMRRFAGAGALYPPDVLGGDGGFSPAPPDPDSTRWSSASTKRRCRRPPARSRCRPTAGRASECMPIEAKAGCLYPNNGAPSPRRDRAASTMPHARHARQRGGDRHRERLHGEGRRRPSRRRRTARSSTASRAGASSRCCARRRGGGRDDPDVTRISRAPTRSSPPATTPRCRRSRASRIANSSRGRSIAKARELYWDYAHGKTRTS